VNIDAMIATRASTINGSGIRRVFEIGATIPPAEKIDLSIGQPDFPVPQAMRDAACRAIQEGRNGYPLTRGIQELRDSIAGRLRADLGWTVGPSGLSTSASDPGVVVTSGTSGALVLACMALLNEGDEVIIPDPYFVLYPYLAHFCNAKAVKCSTYPDFRMTAARVEPLITPKTKLVILNSPSNPAGVCNSEQECRELLDLCRRKGVVLLSDEIYDEFAFSESRTQAFVKDPARKACPSPARLAGAEDCVLVVRGYGKTYGVTGWRLGYAAGPRRLIEEMTKLQQYLYVSSPHPLQWGVVGAFDVDMSREVADYQARRDLVVGTLSKVTEVPMPGGAFYAFVKVPEKFGSEHERGENFFQEGVKRKILVVPGRTFSQKDTHFRLSFATPMEKLRKGLEVLVGMMR
jgi:aspartate/methionine/tyrosine aminotransferase